MHKIAIISKSRRPLISETRNMCEKERDVLG
jgi:hypothetical protein